MEDLGFYSPEEEQRKALNKYSDERKKLSKVFVRTMNKQTRKDHLIEGSVGGIVIGLLFGFIVGQTSGRVPHRDATGRVVEYKYDGKKTLDATLKALAGAVLLMLGLTEVKIIIDKNRNQTWADTLANDTMKKYFDLPLKNYKTDNDTPVRNIQAAALIISNMPQSELDRLRAFATNALVCNDYGLYSVQNDAITAASRIISNFIDYNPQIGYNVLRIMRGEEPTAYFLTSTQQKTR